MNKSNTYEREIVLWKIFFSLLSKVKQILLIGTAVGLLLAGIKYFTIDTQNLKETEYLGTARIYLGSDIDTSKAEAIRLYLSGNDVLQNVISDLDLDLGYNELYKMIDLIKSSDTIIVINVKGQSEGLVQDIAESLSVIGVKKISEKFNKDEVELLEPAYTNVYKDPIEISKVVKNSKQFVILLIRYTFIGFIFGIIFASGMYLFLYLIDSTLKDEKEIKGYLGLPILGYIPIIKGTKKQVKKDKKISLWK